jgi:intracellular septation protein A
VRRGRPFTDTIERNMASIPTPGQIVGDVTKQLRQSAWFFGFFAFVSAVIAYLHDDGSFTGWKMATVLAALACCLAVHFARRLSFTELALSHERQP